MAYPKSMFKNHEGNLKEQVVHGEKQEDYYRKLGFVGLGEGFLETPEVPTFEEEVAKAEEVKRGPGRPPKVV
ncbi:MAG TPA: hypothetical protein VIY48_22160 [Candidatus Paceibacterota bacterium]